MTTSNTQVTQETPAKSFTVDRFIITIALLGMAVLGSLIWMETAPFLVGLFFVGAVLGIALYHGAFGFTAGWRNWVVSGNGTGMRAQLFLLGLACLLIVPVISGGIEGTAGTIAPVGVSLVLGSFIFGFGMQLGGGCGSGTLFTVGAGNLRMVITLSFFIIGSVIGTVHLPFWLDAPGTDPIQLTTSLGPWGAIALQWAVLAGLWFIVGRREKRLTGKTSHGLLERDRSVSVFRTILTGRWPFLWAAVVLAIGNLLTVILSGTPWGVTFAFALWGAKIAQFLGIDMTQVEFWTWDYGALALKDSLLVNVPSVMNFGLLLGAMLAAGLANKYNAGSQNPLVLRSVLAAVIGGTMMGYGARLGFGCNIGAMFSGIASASVHGWIWFASAFVGSLLGIKARPFFGLGN